VAWLRCARDRARRDPHRVASGSHHPRAAARARTQPATRHAKASTPPLPEDDQNAAVSSVLGYTPFVKEGGTRAREIALTFDDGPGPYTPAVLDVLERFTFAPRSSRSARCCATSAPRRCASCATATRSAITPRPTGNGAPVRARPARELFEQIARIELLGGPRPLLFRPPYGSYDATTIRELHKLHLLMVLWSVDTEDYLQPGSQRSLQRALAGAHPARSC